MIEDYLNIKKKNERTRFKAKKGDKRAMVVTWCDNDSSKSESEGEEVTNIILWLEKTLKKVKNPKR